MVVPFPKMRVFAVGFIFQMILTQCYAFLYSYVGWQNVLGIGSLKKEDDIYKHMLDVQMESSYWKY